MLHTIRAGYQVKVPLLCPHPLSGTLQAASWRQSLLHMPNFIRGSLLTVWYLALLPPRPKLLLVLRCRLGLPGVPWPLSRSLLNLVSWPHGVIGSMLPLGVLPLFSRVDSRGPSTGPAGASHSCSKAVVNVPLSPLTIATCSSHCQCSDVVSSHRLPGIVRRCYIAH